MRTLEEKLAIIEETSGTNEDHHARVNADRTIGCSHSKQAQPPSKRRR